MPIREQAREDHFRATLLKMVSSLSTEEIMHICAVFDGKSTYDIYDYIAMAFKDVIDERALDNLG